MIARAILFILVLGIPLSTVIFLGFKRLLRPMLETRRRKLLGARNAEETCDLCWVRTDPATDHFDTRTKRWRHARCVQQLLGEGN